MKTTYILGEVATPTAEFRVGGVLTDPTAVTFTVEQPDGVETTYVYGTDPELIRDSAGIYHVEVLTDQQGTWVYRFVGTGAATGANEGQFSVTSQVVDALDILLSPGDYDSIRAMLGVEMIDLSNLTIELPAYGPYIEARVKVLVPDWATILGDPEVSPFLRAAVRYGVAAELAESYMKGGTVSLVHKEEPRRNWSEWARIFWLRYEESLARVTTADGAVDDDYDLPTTLTPGPTSSRGLAPDWTGVYPPVWPE